MADTDVLDLLFNTSHGIINHQSEKGHQADMMLSDQTLGEFDLDEFTKQFPLADELGLFEPLLDSNLPDDLKQKQLITQQQNHVADHAYSVIPTSPQSDSGVSTGPYSPSGSSNSVEDVGLSDIWEKELFEPLGLNKETDFPVIDDMMMDAWSDNSSSSPCLEGNESPSFNFDDLVEETSPREKITGLTISTNEATKIVKVVSISSVNNKKAQSLITSTGSNKPVSNSPYPELRLSDEEKDLLRKEGISLPSHLPLTREEEKLLRSIRRRIRNKASARNSRKKKQDYMEALEERVKLCTEEKRQLERKVTELEKKNTTLMGQLRKLQKLVADGTRQTAKTGTCAMILALSFALVAFPNLQSLTGGNTNEEGLKSEVSGRTSRSLLFKSEEPVAPAKDDVTYNFMPLFNFNKIGSAIPTTDKPHFGPTEDEFVHDPIEDEQEKPIVDSHINEIHMEITKLPANIADGEVSTRANASHKRPLSPADVVPSKMVKTELLDEF